MSSTAAAPRAPRPVTGRMVLLILVAFFGVIFAANFVLVRVALTSFSGVETDSAYKAGMTFKSDVMASQAQDARHWSVEAAIQRGAETAKIVVTAKDAEAKALTGLVPEIRLSHPTDKRNDMDLRFIEVAPGRYESLTPMPEGRWDLVIGFKRGEETVFLSKSRIML